MGSRNVNKDNTVRVAIITLIGVIGAALISVLVPKLFDLFEGQNESLPGKNVRSDTLKKIENPTIIIHSDSIEPQKYNRSVKKNEVTLDHSNGNTVIQGDSNTNIITIPQ